ncbi:MAG: hypothetical protein NTW20_18380 [Rhodobacterales bacterium]|nr:hypothetical protein [Rhodobacterales bacterium]
MSAKTAPVVNKQLIMVVHGVGIRAAGESSDLVAGALDGTLDMDPAARPNASFRRRSSDDFQLFERSQGAASPIATSFPARITRFRQFEGQFPKPDSPERVISDFYWGDVGGFSGSAPAVLVGLGRIMLGLAHVVRENALTVFPDLASRPQAAWRGLARGAALAIHGPVFALNIALFIGLVFIVLIGDQTNWVSFLTALCCIGLAIWLQMRSASFLVRHMGAYLAVAGLLLLLFTLLDGIAGRPFALTWIDKPFRDALCSWKTAKDSTTCLGKHVAGPFLHAMRLQGFMVVIWSGVALIAVIFGLRWFIAILRRDPGSRSDLLMPTLSLMTLLWFLLIGLGWAVVAAAYGQVGPGVLNRPAVLPTDPCAFGPFLPNSDCYFGSDRALLFTTSLRGVWAAVAMLLILIAVCLGYFVYRLIALRRVSPETYLAAADQNADRLRLVVPGCLRAALFAMPVFILVLIIASAHYPANLCSSERVGKLFCLLEAYITPFLAYAVTGILAAAPLAMRPVSLGINVAGDVIIYLNDFHWRRTPDAAPSRTFAEIAFPRLDRMRRSVLPPEFGYAFRSRIQNRLRNLVDDLIRTEEPDRIDFVCHSQGTVITLDVLATVGEHWGQGRTQTLVTMGSPRRHLYARYFGHAFPELTASPDGVSRWTNIFRIDDFIGTHVRTGSSDEIAIGVGGHTNSRARHPA